MNNQNFEKKDMLLESASGFFMPFPGDEEHDVDISLGFGEQVHPATGQKFNHTGIDLIASHLPLFAVATGAVVGVGSDAVHENYIITRYGKYEVKYGHVSEAYCGYATRVKAGQQIAKSGDFLHLEVKFEGQLIDPVDFLKMLYSNIAQLSVLGIKGEAQFVDLGVPIKTDYDADQTEILQLMMRWLPEYMNEIRTGGYRTSERIEAQLRNIFMQSAEKNYFFESIPDLSNPLGLGRRSSLMAGKVQSLLIGDFLNFLGSRHNIFVSSWDDDKKKSAVDAVPGGMIDPLDTLQIDVQNYDIKRIASVYADSAGERWWTTAWFNGREKSEPSIEIPRRMAVSFIKNQISKDDWLARYFPKQMTSCFNAIEQVRRNLLGI